MSSSTDVEGEVEFSPSRIRRMLPDGVSDVQERALIASIRNPDASIGEVGDATAVEYENVRNALESVLSGVLGGEQSNDWVERREGQREAERFDELTPKQKAVVDFLARTPGWGVESHTSNELLVAIREFGEGHAADAPDMHPTTPKKVAQQYAHLVDERRAYLADQGEIDADVSREDLVDAEGTRVGDYDTPRPILERAGWDLPEENLDDLSTQADALTPEDRLDLAFERGQETEEPEVDRSEYLGPLSCPGCGHEARGYLACPECGGLKVHEDAVDVLDVVDEGLELSDIRRDAVYRAEVNAIEDYGVFVTIAARGRDERDISGLLHINDMPDSIDDVRDVFRKHGYAYVVPTNVWNEDKNAVTITWPTEDVIKSADGYLRSDDGAESGASRPAEGERSDTSDEDEDTDHGRERTPDDAESDPAGATVDDRVEREAIDDLFDRIDELDHRLAGIDEERIVTLEDRVEALAETVPTTSELERLNEAVRTVVDAERGFEELGDRIDAIENRVDRLDEERVGAIEDRVEDLSTTDPNAVGGRFERVMSYLTLLEGDGWEVRTFDRKERSRYVDIEIRLKPDKTTDNEDSDHEQ